MDISAPPLFCASCGSYVGISVAVCPVCRTQRKIGGYLPSPGMPFWRFSPDKEYPRPTALRGQPALTKGLVLFAGGDRQSPGGILALDRATGKPAWQYDFPNSVEGGPVISGERVFFATWNSSGQGVAVYCLQIQTGEEVWTRPLSAGAWWKPVLNEARIYVGCADGRIHCLDTLVGQPIANWSAALGPGRMWLYLERGCLIAIQKQGKVSILDAVRGGEPLRQWSLPHIDISGSAAIWKDQLYFGSEDGQIYALGLRDGHLQPLFRGTGSYRSAPVIEDGVLYAGGMDKTLRAFNLKHKKELWRCSLDHALTTTPALVNGLVVVTVNHGEICAFDAATGQPVWRYQLGQRANLVSEPIGADGVIYVGSDDGCAAALPWHLGQHLWAANWLEQKSQRLAAASHFAAAGDCETCDPHQRAENYGRTIKIWSDLGLRENSARLLEVQLDVEEKRVAKEYEDAVMITNLSLNDPQQAASLLHRAADLYERVADDTAAQRCRQRATRATRSAYLHLRADLIPNEWEAGEEQEAAFVIKNSGNAPAKKVHVRLAGSSLACGVLLEMHDLAPEAQSMIQANLLPLCTGELTVEAYHVDAQGKTWLGSARRYPMTVKPSTATLDVRGDVGALILYEEQLKGKIKVRGDAGLIKVRPDRMKDESTF